MGLFTKKKKDKYGINKKELARINGKPVAYAVERENGMEKVLGKDGGIIVLSDAIVVMCQAHEVFRCRIDGASVAELLSGNGVEIAGIDDETGEKRHIIAHYSYYRK